jgi:hypothetical protein
VGSFRSKLAYFRYNLQPSQMSPASVSYRRGPDPASTGPGPSAPSGWSRVQAFGLTLLAAALVVGALGLVRLGRQFPGAAASPGLLVPFLLPVLALALEAGALVALSVVQLGVLLRGTTPAALLRARATLPLLALLTFVVGVAELIPRGTEHPGAFANELVQTARGSCKAERSVAVPLLGLNVLCSAPPRITGPMPGVRSVQVAMGELTFSDDLRRVEITELELTASRALRVHLKAGKAHIAGLAPWSRSPLLSPFGRFAVLAALGAALWLASSLLWRPLAADPELSAQPGRPWQRLLGALLLAAPGALMAARFISLDQDRAAPSAYASAGLAGVAALWLLGLLARRLPQIFNSFRAF